MRTNLFERLTSVLAVFSLLGLLGSTPAAAAETITYLHTDVAGSPVAATDANGTVVWRQSYRSYGERINNQPASASNRQFFHNKPFDQDSGLSYFGARYYDPVVGRFMGMDPKGFDEKNPHSFNRYAYGNNNPYKYVDPDGLWPTEQHKLSIRRAIIGLSPIERRTLLLQQEWIDKDQANEVQFKHSLSIPGQQPLEAWKLANDFTRNEIAAARDLENAGQHVEALKRLSNAIHTMQDATSPAHKGFQQYDNNWSWSKKIEHYQRETNPSVGELRELDAATRRAWEFFKSNQPLPNEILQRP